MLTRRVYAMNRPKNSNTICKWRWPKPAKQISNPIWIIHGMQRLKWEKLNFRIIITVDLRGRWGIGDFVAISISSDFLAEFSSKLSVYFPITPSNISLSCILNTHTNTRAQFYFHWNVLLSASMAVVGLSSAFLPPCTLNWFIQARNYTNLRYEDLWLWSCASEIVSCIS